VLRRLRGSGSARRSARLRALYRDVRRSCALLDDLHSAPIAACAPAARCMSLMLEHANCMML
jgi:hypothetical protein